MAIAETLFAIFLSLVLVKVLASSVHIVVGTLIAPFLFLRTESSTAKAFAMFDSCFQKLGKIVSFVQRLYQRLSDEKAAVLQSLTFLFVWLPLFSLMAIVIRFIATTATLISFPRETLLAIPENWVRIALRTDHRHPPELLPGVETVAEAPASARTFTFEEIRRHITSGAGGPLFHKISLLATYAPAVIYRLFLKSTSLIYFPLIWLIDLPFTVKGVLSLPLERVRRWYAFAVILIMLSPLAISFRAQETLSTAQDRAIFTYVLPVHRTDWWHIARIVAVGVTIALYFYARKLEENSLEYPESARWIIARANHLRAACAVFTMGCFILIILAL